MAEKNKRLHPRFDSLNLISYVCYDPNEQIVNQGMGRTLNVSESGILLETHVAIAPEHTVSLSIGLEDHLIDVRGRAIYSKAGGGGKFETGIQFLDTENLDMRILKDYIQMFEAS